MAKSKDGKGLGQTVMSMFSLKDPDDDYDDDDLFDDDEIDLVEPKQPKPRKEKAVSVKQTSPSYSSSAKAQSAASYADDDYDDYEPSSYRKPRQTKSRSTSSSGNKVVSMNGRSNELIVIKPQDFNEAQTVTDFLKDGKPIVINMEGIDINDAQRIIDFIGGACYALDGTLGPVSNNIFIAAPQDVEVSGDLRDGFSSESTVSPYLGSL